MKWLDPAIFHLVIVGGGDVFPEVLALIESHGLRDRITTIPKQPFALLKHITQQADLGLSLDKAEKIAVMEAGKAVARGRVPVLSGIAEFTSAFAIDMAKEAARIGLDGVMVMPALVYLSKPHETAAHFRSVAKATDLPVMVYNNPPIYKNDVTPEILASLADCETIVCFKESSGDTRRFPGFGRPLRLEPTQILRPLRAVGFVARRGGLQISRRKLDFVKPIPPVPAAR